MMTKNNATNGSRSSSSSTGSIAGFSRKQVFGLTVAAVFCMAVGSFITEVLHQKELKFFVADPSLPRQDTEVAVVTTGSTNNSTTSSTVPTKQTSKKTSTSSSTKKTETTSVTGSGDNTDNEDPKTDTLQQPLTTTNKNLMNQTKFQQWAKIKRKSLSLVTSVWALPEEEEEDLQRSEVLASIANNLYNPHFDHVIVILDSVTKQSNCTHFQKRMKQLQMKFRFWTTSNNMRGLLPKNSITRHKLICIDRKKPQPNYYEMFTYATNPKIVKSEVVVLANADQAFDDTVQWATLIKSRTLLTIPTQGYQPHRAPTRIRAFFQFAHGPAAKGASASTTQSSLPNNTHLFPWCQNGQGQPTSWDGYVFTRTLIAGKLQPDAFRRGVLTSAHGRPNGTAFFPMNEMGAENAALHALLSASNLYRVHDANGCSVIHSWHIHAGSASTKQKDSSSSPTTKKKNKKQKLFWNWKHPNDPNVGTTTSSGTGSAKKKDKNKHWQVPTPWREPLKEVDDAFLKRPSRVEPIYQNQ